MSAGKRSNRAPMLYGAGFGIACALSGCRAMDRHEAERIPQYGQVDFNQPRELDKVSMPARIVEPPDEIEVLMRPTDPDVMTTRFIVQPEGTIDLGIHGEVYVAGLTVREVQQKVTMHLAQSFSTKGSDRKPPRDVVVRLLDNQSKFYYVIGTVSTQNRFPINGNTTVLDAILQAGLRSNSVPEKAYLVRPHPNGSPDTVLSIDWEGITKRGDTLTNYQLLPGDRIYVPGTRPPSVLSSLLGGG